MRILAWRLLHEPRLASPPGWLAPFWPRPGGDLDRDPVALLLAALAVGLAALYLAAALCRARPALRGLLIACGSAVLIVGPSLAFVGMGFATGRPYGQDGGVVQLPLAIDRILAGQSPYAANYSDSMLGKQSRASEFWAPWGGNPILRHHAYLPGTHLLMLPFHLACRGLGSGFDPRLVTLLFYALCAAVALRLVVGTPERLCAAAAVALNPLVYWQQVFGANDVMFAALLLLAVWLAERGDRTLAGAALGLACATKQLAWPFAPFLLAQLSGATSLRDLWTRAALGRLARPLLAAGLVFVAVVAPVAALDFRAFYGDIVAYNMGLPGTDNYPLGGTPGFGFANFLLYFGKVTSLRDHFPFGVFCLILVPAGLLLLRVQLRDGSPATALLTGSAGLLLALYFSRVVHPNYLIGAAVLLPTGVLARRRGADLAVAPLLLLGLAAEVAEGQLFRATWDQAVALRLPAHLGGLAAAWAPRGGSELTLDPLGALVSAVAAGLGVAYLTIALLGASARVRSALVVLSAGIVVGIPTVVLVGIGHRTGAVRAQDRWAVQVPADAQRLSRGESPYRQPFECKPSALEAWSTSFRQGPPRRLEPDRPLQPPGAAALGVLSQASGIRDGRVLSLLGVAALIASLAITVPPAARPLTLAVSALIPFLALGTTFGAPFALPLAALVSGAGAAVRGKALLAGILGGLAGALDPRALLAAPFLALRLATDGRRRLAAGFVGGYAALVLPAVAPDPLAFVQSLSRGVTLEPGVGLANLLFFKGWQDSAAAHALYAVLPWALLLLFAASLRLAWMRRNSAPALSALVVLLSLFLAPSASAESLGMPVVLLLLAKVGEDAWTSDRPPSADSSTIGTFARSG